MLPSDDQIVNYGLDSTCSVSRSFPSKAQFTAVESCQTIDETVNNKQKAIGVSSTHRKTRTVEYTIKNNSTEREVSKFYVDHTADSSCNGFTITTKQNCIKSVTGWSRFE